MPTQPNSYKQIVKATSLFGGVQVFNIIIAIIRSKFIAVLLGPVGIGIAGLLTSTIGLISGITNFGLGTSAVKNVAEANGTGNIRHIATIVTVLRRLVWLTGILGTIVTIVLSSWLSQLTFGNRDYTYAFIYISVTLLLNQLSSGQLVVLQGLQKLKHLAKANLSGSVLGLFISVPLYYLWGVKAIVPAIIISSALALVNSWYFSSKIKIEPIKVSKAITVSEGKKMLVMGFMISLSGLITIGVSYLVRIYISDTGGIEEVGLYTAGVAIINTYIGLVFSAMATDYYPRLSSVANNNELCKNTINEQAEITVLILSPIIIIFLVFINWVIIILYSNKFIAINEMIHWAILGTLFKAANWSIGFVFLAKSATKLYFTVQLSINIIMLVINIIGYKYWGLTGLGITFLLAYIINLLQVYIISRLKYKFNFNKAFVKVFVVQFILSVICFISIKYFNTALSYVVGITLIALSTMFSIFELNNRINLRTTISDFYNKFKR